VNKGLQNRTKHGLHDRRGGKKKQLVDEGIGTQPCPCTNCKGKKRKSLKPLTEELPGIVTPGGKGEHEVRFTYIEAQEYRKVYQKKAHLGRA